MSFTGLVCERNLSDVTNPTQVWDNLGTNVSYTINGITSTVTIKGKDIAALRGIYTLDAGELLYLSNLASAAQPRLSTITANVNTAASLQAGSMLKASPTTTGTFGISGALSATSLRINGVPIQSLSGSPFSGGTATGPIRLGAAAINPSFALSTTVESGAISTPSLAIPVEVNGAYLYLKAGQS